MDKTYWEGVWRNDDLGFHQPQVNRHLQRFWQRLELIPNGRVFVPLCGKSLDMDWLLSEGHEVIIEEVFLLKRKAPAGMGRLPIEAGESQTVN